MLENIIPLIGSWLPMFSEYLIFYLAGSIVCIAGCLIHRLLLR